MAPDLRGKVAFASMAAAEMGPLRDSGNGVDGTWPRDLRRHGPVRSSSRQLPRVDDTVDVAGIAREGVTSATESLPTSIARSGTPSPADVAEIVEDVLSQTGHSEFVVLEVKAAVEASTRAKDRLMLWDAVFWGEAITQAQFVLAQREDLTDLVISASGDLNGVVALFDGMQAKHAERMAILGLV